MVSDVKHIKASYSGRYYIYNVFGLLVVMFFRFVTAGEIQKRSEFFEPFIMGLTNATVEQVCSIK